MRHGVKTSKIGVNSAHRKSIFRNLAMSVIRQGLAENQMDRHVRTTLAKAKVIRGLVDRLVTYAKKGDLSARRQAAKFFYPGKENHENQTLLKDLFEKIGPRYSDRPGGYTRVLKLGRNRPGDASEMALVSLVEDMVVAKSTKPVKAKATTKKAPSTKKKIDIVAEKSVEEVSAKENKE